MMLANPGQTERARDVHLEKRHKIIARTWAISELEFCTRKYDSGLAAAKTRDSQKMEEDVNDITKLLSASDAQLVEAANVELEERTAPSVVLGKVTAV